MITIKASDMVPGQWYDHDDVRCLCIYNDPDHGVRIVRHGGILTHTISLDAELIYLPDCTGWDCQPPKPEKQYRAFASFEEWWPHRERWVRTHETCVIQSNWYGTDSARRDFENGFVFVNDDGSDGEPFGVAVSECSNCGIGFRLPSGRCDHCDLKILDTTLHYAGTPSTPEKRYRAFVSGAEFKPNRERWVDEGGRICKIQIYCDSFIEINDTNYDWKLAFEHLKFEDGEPFGVEITQ